METFQELDRQSGPSDKEQEGGAKDQSPEYMEEDTSPVDMYSYAPEPDSRHKVTPQVNDTSPMKARSSLNGPPSIKAPNSTKIPTRSAGGQVPQSTKKLNESLQVDVVEMRARAHRLRSQAMRLEAEAFELESQVAMAREALRK